MANLVLAPHRDPARDGRIDPGDRPRANGGGAVVAWRLPPLAGDERRRAGGKWGHAAYA
jgi:hypothetical protein